MQLTLYHFESCPFCQLVRDYMAKNNISIPLKDIRVNPTYREELKKIGGRTQAPCLVIDGKPLYESEDIIQWLKKSWRKP